MNRADDLTNAPLWSTDPRPLITRDLVQRLEAAEAAYTEAKLRALGEADGHARGVEVRHVGSSVLLSIQSQRNNPSVNRVTGFAAEDLEHLAGILGWLRDRSEYFWFDVAPALADDATLKALADEGLYASFFLNVLYTTPSETPDAAPPGVVVHEVDLRENTLGFCLAFSQGFGIPLELIERTEESARIEHSAPGWRTYLAAVDGQPASMATLYLDGEIASIDAMATAPDFRRRGCQSALLRRCIHDAAQAGCTLLASQTRPSSGSERNFARAGFQVAYTKLLYAPRKPERPRAKDERRAADDGRRSVSG